MFLCRFFAVENGGEETRARGADQRVAGLGRNFFFHLFRLRSTSEYQSVALAKSFLSLGRSWALRYDQENEKTSLPINNGEEFMESKTG